MPTVRSLRIERQPCALGHNIVNNMRQRLNNITALSASTIYTEGCLGLAYGLGSVMVHEIWSCFEDMPYPLSILCLHVAYYTMFRIQPPIAHYSSDKSCDNNVVV
jgi:hypothetical protein